MNFDVAGYYYDGVVDTDDQLLVDFVATSDAPKVANISANFCKKFKLPQKDTQGPGGN